MDTYIYICICICPSVRPSACLSVYISTSTYLSREDLATTASTGVIVTEHLSIAVALQLNCEN